MMTIYKSTTEGLTKIDAVEEGCWINLVAPNNEEIQYLEKALDVDRDFLTAAMDEEERARIEYDDDKDAHLIVIDMPYADHAAENSITYGTIPMGIIRTQKALVTVCLRDSGILKSFENGKIKTFYTYKKSRFILLTLYKTSVLYLQYLKQIDKKSVSIESELQKSMKNKELIQLMELEKSLVYFSTSLKSNEIVLERLLRLEFIKKYPEDKELLEDTIIENKQAIEMAKIYSDILAGTMDAFASIISNNLNIVMKLLTSVTIVMSIPNMISGLYGMNVSGAPFAGSIFGFWIILFIAVICCAFAAFFMARKKLF